MTTTTPAAPKLPPLPSFMKRLPRDSANRPIPFFAAEVDGKHDFRVMDAHKLVQAISEELCFVCGNRLRRARSGGPTGTFVAGPMCLVNRTSAEPPNHEECAEWSAMACPFLTTPGKERREAHMPEHEDPAGIMLPRNPGVTALIASDRWRVFRVPSGMGGDGLLHSFVPTGVIFMTKGRRATTPEVMASIDSGLPALMEMVDDSAGEIELGRRLRNALRFLATPNPEGFGNVKQVLRWQ